MRAVSPVTTRTVASRPALALLAAALPLAPLSGLEAKPQVYVAPFYANTDALNPQGKPLGTVLASKPALSTVPGSKAWRIAYVSSDAANRPTVVTALIAVPEGTAPAGGRPVLAWAHGTTGTARRCGPSQLPQPAQPLNEYFLPSGTSYSDFGLPAMTALIRKGYSIVATDYQGLGGPGDHQYGLHRTAAYDVINSIRAARSFKPAQAGDQAVIMGWSQGGGAVLMAAGLNDYVKKQNGAAAVNLVGVVGLAPSDARVANPGGATNEAEAQQKLAAFTKLLAGSDASLTHLSMFYWGVAAGNPDLRLSDVFTANNLPTLSTLMRNKCVHELGASYSYTYGNNLFGIFNAKPTHALAWTRAINKDLVASDQPLAPVLITWGNHDTVVPPVMHQVYAKSACAKGANITRVELPGNNTHFTTPTASEPFYLPWITARFAGRVAVNGCASLQSTSTRSTTTSTSPAR